MHAGVVFVEKGHAGFEDELAAIRHRVAGVEREIENGGRKLTGIDGRHACFVFKRRFDLDLLAERGPQQLGGVDDQLIDVGLPRLQRLLAGERKQMLGKIRAP